MKRTLLLILILLGFTSNAFSAGTCVQQGDLKEITDYRNGKAGYRMTILCTAHTDNSLSAALSAETMKELGGMLVKSIKSYPGATAPTDNSDLEIADSDGLSLLGSNGTDFIDATTTKATIPYNSFLSVNDYILVANDDVWTITMTNNAEASATFYLKVYGYKINMEK